MIDEKHPKKKTRCCSVPWISCFERQDETNGRMTPQALNKFLSEFLITVRKKEHNEEYEPNSLRNLFASLGFLSKRGAILSQTWSDTLKTKGDTQAVYNKFDMKVILMPLWKEKEAWAIDIARSLAMLQKNTQCTRSAHIEFWMHLNSLFNKCRRTVTLIPTKLCQDKQNFKSTAILPRRRTDFVKHDNLTDQYLNVFFKIIN